MKELNIKKIYVLPEVEIQYLHGEDVVRTSNPDDPGDDDIFAGVNSSF